MNKKDNVAMVPKYRFPEFSESWDIIPILNIGDVYNGGIFSKSDIDQNASIPCIHYGELFTKYNEVISIIYSKTNKKEGFKSKIGDILMPSSDVTPDGLAKASAIMLEDVILGGDMNIIRPNKKFNSIFISYLLNKSKKEIIKLVSGTTIKHIYPCQIITCQLPIANNSKEQQKIADCLFSIDKLISTEEKKLSLLQNYKKGWMQKLFPAEGKTIPEWRFPEFKDDNNWKCVEIETVGKVITGKTPPTSNDSLWNGSIQFVTPTDIVGDKYQRLVQRTVVKTSKMKVLPKGTIMFTCIASIGKMAISVYPCVTNQQINSIITNKGYYNEFIYYSLFRNVNKIKSDLSNTTVPIINKTDFSKIQISVTLNEKEQQKIANFLSGIDDLISNQKDRIEALKQHKKALMQGLFPAVEEVL